MRRVVLAFLAVSVIVAGTLALGLAGGDDRGRQAPASRPDPVLLVHGFDGSANSWGVMQRRLRQEGYRAEEIAAVTYDSRGSTSAAAHVIERAVDRLRARTGAARVDVVSHSLGAMASRMYVEQLDGAASVDAWVSLGGVNDGTVWAYGCILLPSCRDMLPGSAVLDSLNRDFRPGGRVRYAAWWSPCDLAIVPRSAATLDGARNVETACLGHSELKTDRTVFTQVERFVGGPHRNLSATRSTP